MLRELATNQRLVCVVNGVARSMTEMTQADVPPMACAMVFVTVTARALAAATLSRQGLFPSLAALAANRPAS